MKKLILFELRKVFSKRLALIALIGIIKNAPHKDECLKYLDFIKKTAPET